jgi:hypothetical protein
MPRAEGGADFKGGTGAAVCMGLMGSREGFKEKGIKGGGKGTGIKGKGAM